MDTPAALRDARRRAGLTQAALAGRAGTSQAAVSAYESGAKTPSLHTLSRLLAAADAELAVVPARRRRREPTPRELERAGRTLAAVMALAEALPTRHDRVLLFPRIGR